MELLETIALLIGVAFWVGVIALIVWIVKRIRRPSVADAAKRVAKKHSKHQSVAKQNRPERLTNFTKPAIPDAHQIYLDRRVVAGVQHYADQVWDLAALERPRLEWEREPHNSHDANAIAVFGRLGSDRFLVGHVDRFLAAALAQFDDFDKLAVRFEGAKASEKWSEVTYQITGPKGGKKAFLDFLDKHLEIPKDPDDFDNWDD